jgi:hypothetical protein
MEFASFRGFVDHVGRLSVINSGRISGTARRPSPSRSLPTPEESERRARFHALEVVSDYVPALRSLIDDQIPNPAPDAAEDTIQKMLARREQVVSSLNRFVCELRDVGYGRSGTPDALLDSYKRLVAQCLQCDIPLDNPQTMAGRVGKQLEAEVEGLARFLSMT